MTPIPVVVVAGFLGSGKTTLVNHVLANAEGLRVGVLVNDFGAINIDALLVSAAVGNSVSLSNGCICCTTDDGDFEEALATLSQSALDLILVEASGLAEPAVLAERVRAAASARLRGGGLVYLVDANDRAGRQQPHFRAHLRAADLVVLTKVDAAAAPDRASARGDITAAHPGVPIIETSGGRLAPGVLVDLPPATADTAARQLTLLDELSAQRTTSAHDEGSAPHRHAHEQWQAVELTATRPLHPRRLADFLIGQRGVFRMKGVVQLAGVPADAGLPDWLVVHVVGGRVGADTATRRSRQAVRGSTVVVIGVDLDASDLAARFADVETDGGDVDSRAYLSMTRYLDA